MRLALLTGGSRGLGLALHETLAAGGFRVIEFSRGAPHAGSIRADLSSPADSLRAVSGAIDALGNESVEELCIFNNAGTLEPVGPASRNSRDALIANLNTNFTSAILVLTEIIASFQATPCRKVIVNISSGAAQNGYAGWSLYCAAKAGMENFIRAVALEQNAECHPFIPVNVSPGVMDTGMQALIRESSTTDFPDLERFIQYKEQGSLAPPAKIAAAIFRIVTSPSLSAGARYDVADYAT